MSSWFFLYFLFINVQGSHISFYFLCFYLSILSLLSVAPFSFLSIALFLQYYVFSLSFFLSSFVSLSPSFLASNLDHRKRYEPVMLYTNWFTNFAAVIHLIGLLIFQKQFPKTTRMELTKQNNKSVFKSFFFHRDDY